MIDYVLVGLSSSDPIISLKIREESTAYDSVIKPHDSWT